MEETPVKKTCAQCSAVHPATNDFFGTDNSQADSLRRICKTCYSENRSKKRSPEEKRLVAHARVVADAKRRLAQPAKLSAGELHKLDQIIRLDEERIEKLREKVAEQRKEAETAQQLATAGPSLSRVRALGSSMFAADGSLLSVSDRAAQLAIFKAALTTLTGAADTAARDYVNSNIRSLEEMLGNTAARETFIAQQEQDTLNAAVSSRVIGKMYDLYLPQIRAAIGAEAKISLRENIRARKKQLLAMAKTATGKDSSGAEKVVVAKSVADALEKLALMLYDGTKAPLPSDTLANLESRLDTANAMQEWLETEEAKRQAYWQELKERDPKQFERESKSLVLQIRSDGPFAAAQRKSMAQLKRDDPAEYERRALDALKPRNVAPQHIVYVVMEGKRETWLWPDGRLVKKGVEVTYDARTKRFCLMPSPAGVELDAVTATGRQKMELNQHDDGSFHWEPEGSQGTWSQQKDGSWKQDAGSGGSPWTKQERITFRKAEPPASPEHTEFRHGEFWTKTEVEEAARTDAANPPSLLPPLPRFAVADSLALPPERPHPEDNIEPNIWKRWEQKQREDKAREAELLRN